MKTVQNDEEKTVYTEEQIDALRKKYLKADFIWKCASVLVLAITVVYIVLTLMKKFEVELYISAIITLILLIAIFICVYMLPHFLKMSSKMKEYSTHYKDTFLKPMLENAFKYGDYSDFEKISTRELTRISMLKKAKSAVANDCIRGEYKDIKFLRYDLALRYGKKKSSSNCVLIVASVDTKLKSEVQMIGKNFKIGGMEYDQPENYCKILSSNESFDSKFDVYVKEQDDGQKFLKASMAGKIAKINLGGPIAIFFNEEDICLIVKKKKDAMEAPVYSKVKRSRAEKDAEEEIEIIKDWIELLKEI